MRAANGSGYGFYIGSDKDRMERWLRRGDSEECRKAVRKEFHNDKIRAHIKEQSPVLCGHFEDVVGTLLGQAAGIVARLEVVALQSFSKGDNTRRSLCGTLLHGTAAGVALGVDLLSVFGCACVIGACRVNSSAPKATTIIARILAPTC